MTIDLSRILDSEPKQPLKWLGRALETLIRGHGGMEQASQASNRGTRMRRIRFRCITTPTSENVSNRLWVFDFVCQTVLKKDPVNITIGFSLKTSAQE